MKGTPPASWPYPRWIAHRGAGKLAPENTLAAFRVGATHGYRAFECDVKLSRDGVPFLLHDATLDRTTNAHGVAAEHDWAELSLLDAGGWHSSAYAGEPLPTLDAIACFVRRNGLRLNIELKPTPGEERKTGRLVGQSCLRLWQGEPVPPLFSSFQPEALEGVRETAPAWPRALLVESLWPGWLETAATLGCGAVVTRHGLMDEAVRGALRAAGLRALCYTVNETIDVERLRAMAVDGIITDAVDRFVPD